MFSDDLHHRGQVSHFKQDNPSNKLFHKNDQLFFQRLANEMDSNETNKFFHQKYLIFQKGEFCLISQSS
jgi:hypothetical protein